MGGKVDVESKLGEGSTFKITITSLSKVPLENILGKKKNQLANSV
jgi:light-regulated signal transduction histidine kinase (bacteriophytochrome)